MKFLLFILCAIPTIIYANWKVSVNKDEFKGTQQCFVTYQHVTPTRKQVYPFDEIKANIGIGFNSIEKWIYFDLKGVKIGYLTQLNRIKSIRVKFDDNYIQNYKVEPNIFMNTNQSYLILKQQPSYFISQLSKSNQLMISLQHMYNDYEDSIPVYFKYNLAGFTKAYNKASRLCGYDIAIEEDLAKEKRDAEEALVREKRQEVISKNQDTLTKYYEEFSSALTYSNTKKDYYSYTKALSFANQAQKFLIGAKKVIGIVVVMIIIHI